MNFTDKFTFLCFKNLTLVESFDSVAIAFGHRLCEQLMIFLNKLDCINYLKKNIYKLGIKDTPNNEMNV